MAKFRFGLQAVLKYRGILEDEAKRAFADAQRAVTPGQSAVFYQDRVCLGGCIVDSAGN